MKFRRLIFSSIIASSFLLNVMYAWAITRDQTGAAGHSYATLSYELVALNLEYPPFDKPGTVTGVAFWMADYPDGDDSISEFLQKIKDGKKPRTEAGIDCSALVSRCLGIPRQGTWQLEQKSLPLVDDHGNPDYGKLRKGDILVKYLPPPEYGHSMYYAGGGMIYIASALNGPAPYYYNRVMYHDLYTYPNYDLYPPRTLFPLFSEFRPAEGEITNDSTPEIKVTIKSGTDIKASSIIMRIDGNPVSPTLSPPTDAKEITVSYTPTEDLSDGQHEVYVYAINSLNLEDSAVHHFKIGPPFVLTVNPPFAEVSKGETITHTVTVKNNYVPESEIFSLSAYGFAPGWSVSGLDTHFSLPPGSETSYPFLVANSGGYGDVDIDVDLIAMAEMATQEVYDWSAEPYNPYEHPDETYEISSSNYPTPWKIDTQSKIGILLSGWGNGLGHLLGRWNIATVGVRTDLTIVGEPNRSLSDLDVLLIGTGGLTGLESSYTFRNKLAGFVNHGGVLISLTSQYGYELNALPGSPSGYGWSEDQSCHTNAVYIDAYHPMFAGQDSAILDASVDGYLTQWPNGATILLRRTKNQMPAMVKYDYGQGEVVVLTFFTDWNYGHGGWTQDEINLIRDLISWAKKPDKEIKEYKPGDMVNISIPVTNYMDISSDTILLTLLDPNRNVIDTTEVVHPLNPGESTQIPFTHFATQPLGIWLVNYALKDSSGNTIQPETEGEIKLL